MDIDLHVHVYTLTPVFSGQKKPLSSDDRTLLTMFCRCVWANKRGETCWNKFQVSDVCFPLKCDLCPRGWQERRES